MQAYNKIFNPYTNSFVKTNSNNGRYLINNMTGGAHMIDRMGQGIADFIQNRDHLGD